MKRLIIAISIVFIFFSGGIGHAVDLKIQTGTNFDWWESDKDDQGYQIYVPVQIETEYKDFSFLILTAFTHTNSDLTGIKDHSLSCVVDTKVNFSYEILDKFPVDILLGVDFNIPTGRTDLDNDDLMLFMNPDLVSITSLGEGYNINPTLTMAKEWENWAAGVGLGYLWRGKYDFSQETRDYNPGNLFNLTGEVAYTFLPDWQARLFGEYVYFDKDEVRNVDFYQEGEFLLIGLGFNHYRTKWDASFIVKGIFRGKSKFQEEAPAQALRTEDRNNYGDEWSTHLSCNYYLNKKTTLKSLIHFLRVNENDYSSDSPLFIGKKQMASLAFGITRIFGPRLEGELNLTGRILDDDKNWYYDDDRTYKGFSIGVKLKGNF